MGINATRHQVKRSDVSPYSLYKEIANANASGNDGIFSTVETKTATLPELAGSWQDYAPVWGPLRGMTFNMNCRTGGCNFGRAAENFVLLAADLSTFGAAAWGRSVARAGVTEAGEMFAREVITETTETGATSVRQYIVYQGVDPATQSVRYVGQTSRELLVREAEHIASRTERATLRFFEVGRASTRLEARILEQTFINQNGGKAAMQSGQLYNKINSVAPKFWEIHRISSPR